MEDELLQLSASPAFIRALDGLRSGSMSRADVIQRAVVLYSHALEQEREGRHLGFVVQDTDGRDIVEEIIDVSA